MKPWKVLNLTVALLVLVIMGCTKPESKLVGKWQNERLPETVQFFDNKTGVFEVTGNPSLPFNWSMVDKSRVKLDINHMNTTKSLTGRLDSEKEVFILEANDQQAVYKKVK